MKEVQKEHVQFQDLKGNNTLGVMNYMEDNIKITPDTQESTEIKQDNLNEDEQAINRAVQIFTMDIGHPVQIDLSGKIIYDGDDIYAIEKVDGEYQVNLKESKEKKEEKKGPQLVMKKNNIDKAA
jgi:hypothetical protein